MGKNMMENIFAKSDERVRIKNIDSSVVFIYHIKKVVKGKLLP